MACSRRLENWIRRSAICCFRSLMLGEAVLFEDTIIEFSIHHAASQMVQATGTTFHGCAVLFEEGRGATTGRKRPA